MALTKSLHTVTATLNVARFLATAPGASGAQYRNDTTGTAPFQLAHDALQILGYSLPIASLYTADPTIAKCVDACGKLLRGMRVAVAA